MEVRPSSRSGQWRGEEGGRTFGVGLLVALAGSPVVVCGVVLLVSLESHLCGLAEAVAALLPLVVHLERVPGRDVEVMSLLVLC